MSAHAWIYAGLFCLSAFMFALDVSQHDVAREARQSMTDLTAPVLEGVSGLAAATGSVFDGARDHFRLSDEVERLRDENRNLRDWRQKALELENRAERYEALLQMQPDSSSVITARAIGDVRTPFARSLIINAGEIDGVSQGNAVLGAKGLVGRVISAGTNTARVLLVNDIESRIPVHVGAGKYRSILAGTNGREPTLMHLPAGADLSNGDIVLTSGEAQLLPPGLTVGEVRLGGNGSVSVVLGSDPTGVEFVRVVNSEFPIDVADGAPPLPERLADGGAIADPVPIAAVVPLDDSDADPAPGR